MWKYYVVLLFSSCISNFIVKAIANDDIDGQLTLFVYHSLEPGPVPIYVSRGTITMQFSKHGDASYHQEKPMSNADIFKLKKLAQTDGIYRLKLSSKAGEINNQSVFTFTKACAVYESGLTDTITVTLDQSGFLVGVAVSAIPPYCTGTHVPDSKLHIFNTSVNIVSLVNGPAPDTLTYIQRLEQEKAEKARGEQGDNRSFFAKYWMYIVPLVIFLLISGASTPEGQGAAR